MVKSTARRSGKLKEIDFQSIFSSLNAIGQIDQVVSYNEFFLGDPMD